MTRLSGISIAMALSVGGTAFAIPTMWIQVPTASVSEPGGGFVDISAYPQTDLDLDREDVYLETNFGLRGGVEAGYDAPIDEIGEGSFFVKRALPPPAFASGAAIGVNGIGDGTPDPYVVASTEEDGTAWHVGAWYLDEKLRAMAAVEYSASDDVTLVGDWVSGDSGGVAYGFNCSFGPEGSWFLLAGHIINNEDSSDDTLYVSCGRSISF